MLDKSTIRPLLGRTCAHNFCPPNSNCLQVLKDSLMPLEMNCRIRMASSLTAAHADAFFFRVIVFFQGYFVLVEVLAPGNEECNVLRCSRTAQNIGK